VNNNKNDLITGVNCGDVADHLSDYYDGDIPQQLCNKIEKHVESCTDCYAVLNTFNKTIELYKKEAEGVKVSDDARHRLHTVLHLEDLLKDD